MSVSFCLNYLLCLPCRMWFKPPWNCMSSVHWNPVLELWLLWIIGVASRRDLTCHAAHCGDGKWAVSRDLYLIHEKADWRHNDNSFISLKQWPSAYRETSSLLLQNSRTKSAVSGSVVFKLHLGPKYSLGKVKFENSCESLSGLVFKPNLTL